VGNVFVLLALAVGLSADAFAVSVGKGLSAKRADTRAFVFPAAVFGVLQGVMSLIGYFAGAAFLSYIEAYLGIISFAILLAIGLKMLIGGAAALRSGAKRDHDAEKSTEKQITRAIDELNKADAAFSAKEVIPQGVATSIDALAVGVSLLNFPVPIFVAAPVIAAVTFAVCLIGVFFGFKAGKALKAKNGVAEIIGGAMLIAVGIGLLF
jgi:putative Mn2+ efflux pump MntP